MLEQWKKKESKANDLPCLAIISRNGTLTHNEEMMKIPWDLNQSSFLEM